MFYLIQPHNFEELIKKSRFIGVIAPCENEPEVVLELKKLQIAHPHANHIVFAYRLKTPSGIIYRFHDAGEPTGTAGKPIFHHIEGKNIVNVVVAVVRYFGGVKLGAGGLTRAYGNTAKQVIDGAALLPFIEMATLEFTLDYEQFQYFEYALKKVDGKIIEQDFGGQITLTVKLPAENVADLTAHFLPSSA
jgi:uncharacterized YigZ family protein